MGIKKYIHKKLEPAIKADEQIREISRRSSGLVSNITGSSHPIISRVLQTELDKKIHRDLRRNLLRETLRNKKGRNTFLNTKVKLLEKYLDHRNRKLNRT
jgi:hypothetical protein